MVPSDNLLMEVVTSAGHTNYSVCEATLVRDHLEEG